MEFLYVEDHFASRRIMQVVVEHFMGCTVATLEDSHNIEAQVDHLETEFTVILLDLRLKPDDGFSVQEKLKAHHLCKNARFVAVTANLLPGEVRRLKEQGFAGLLLKPVNAETFPDYIHRILNGEKVWELG